MSRDDLGEELREFLIEAYENLDRTEQDLLGLDPSATHAEVVAATFRTLHSIKGACGFFDFAHLAELAHEGESLLGVLRDADHRLDDTMVQLLLDLLDGLRRYLANIETSGDDGEDTEAELCAGLRVARQEVEAGDVERNMAQFTVPSEVQLAPNIVVFTPTGEAAPPAKDPSPVHANLLDQAIRVDVGALDRLVNLVGELVLIRNRTLQINGVIEDAELGALARRLNLITTQLQEQIMQTRMQPMESLLAKLPRLVRDLARSLGKQVALTVTGGETELDRGILEALRDPLVHLLRNAVDHGIEFSDVRVGVGKGPVGHLEIVARHEGGSVIVTIADDGAGIDPSTIADRALRLGLVSPQTLSSMSARDRLDLIFLPGFSTSEEVTSVSGRGVGMDVVRTNVEQVSGTIEINSQAGKGTTIVLRIPLTLAIIPSLMLLVAGQRFALPQLGVVELLRLERESMADELAFIGESLFLRRNAQLLPVVDLAQLLGLGSTEALAQLQLVTIVVVQLGGRQFGLIVDRVVDTQEIVVKPLDSFIAAIGIYAGATILGDGEVAMILDVAGIASRATLSLDDIAVSELGDAHEDIVDEEIALLIDEGEAGLVAVPVFEVERIEEVDACTIEYLGTVPVIQYRGVVVEVVAITSLLQGDTDLPKSGALRILVPSFGNVDRVVAIREVVDIATIGGTESGSTIVGGRIVRIISLAEALMTRSGASRG
ncbi:chemotaxis protein CheA [Ferrimicrobium sp.]|uniref:chemotaxis protein CheA n=1 Tax=Ferrimicrobium sp. TaxID=2926050 RepID=UPI00261ECA6D|nr:chemotaxis protein CheA [Ferrimicrobium sp.]